MLESEAKEKWCPFVRTEENPNRTSAWDPKRRIIRPEGMANFYCIGSGCAVWVETDFEALPTPPDGEPDFFPAGYCGLIRSPYHTDR